MMGLCQRKLGHSPSRAEWNSLRHEWPGFMPNCNSVPLTFGETSWRGMLKQLGMSPYIYRAPKPNRNDYPEPVCRPVRIEDLPADFFRRRKEIHT